MARSSKFTSVPRSGKADPQMDALAANIELITGQKGRGEKRAVLVEDLERLGFVKVRKGLMTATPIPGAGGSGGGIPPTNPVIEPPTAPQNVIGYAGFQYASLSWDIPTYVGHAYAEVWMASVDDFSTAARIGVTAADLFSILMPINGDAYFWVRFVNQAGLVGPLHSGLGIHITTVGDVDDLLDEMVDKIDFIHLAPPLEAEVIKIPAIETSVDDVINVKIPAIDLEVGKIPSIESDVNDIRDNKIPAMQNEVDKIQGITDDIDKIVNESLPDVRLDIDDLISSVESQWEDSETLSESIIENALGSDYDRESNSARFAAIKNTQNVVVDDQQAMAEQITVLVAQFDGHTAEYTSLVKVVATNELSMTQQFTSLNSKIDNVEAGIYEDVYTKVQSDEAIASATTSLKADIEDPNGTSLGANLYNNYYTKVGSDSAISSATQLLKSDIEDPNGSSIGATLKNDYYTSVDTDQAIAAIETSLRSEYKSADQINSNATDKAQADADKAQAGVDDINADLAVNYFTQSYINNNYYTQADTDGAIAAISTTLRSEYQAGDAVNKADNTATNDDLANNYYSSSQIDTKFYTKTDTEGAISTAFTTLKAEVEDPNGTSIGADLSNNYYTKVDADSAIAAVETSLSSEFRATDKDLSDRLDGVEAGVGDSYTKAEIDNNFYTKADANSAIAAATTSLKAEMEDPNGSSIGAELNNNYYTKVESDSAISTITTTLRSEYTAGDTANKAATDAVTDDLANNYFTSSDITTNYYTSAEVDTAISSIETTLRSEYQSGDGVISDGLIDLDNKLVNKYTTTSEINQNFYTKTDVDQAIASIEVELNSEWRDVTEDLAENAIENAAAVDGAQESNRKHLANINTKQSTFADAQEAIALDLIELTANVDGNQATLRELRQTQADHESASSFQITTLSSSIDGVTSDLSVNYYTKVDTDAAISSIEQSLRSEYQSGDKVNADATDAIADDLNNNYFTSSEVTSNYYTSAEVDSAIGSITETVAADWRDESDKMSETDIEGAIGDDEGQDRERQNYAEIKTTQYAFASEQESFAQKITELTAVVDGNEAGIKEVQQVQTTHESAAAQQLLSLRSDIDGVSSSLDVNYYTKVETDTAVSKAITTLKAEIEDPTGASIGADLANNYYTSADTDAAISQSETKLRSEFNVIGTDLTNNYYTSAQIDNNYYTKADSDAAISAIETTLRSEYQAGDKTNADATDAVKDDLTNNYYTAAEIRTSFYTKSASDSSVAQAITNLKSEIEDPNGTSVGATIANNYYTKVESDSAISEASTIIKSEIEDPKGTSLGASLDVLSQTIVDVDGYQQALWGVKATAGDVTASIGLVAKSNPSSPDISNAYFVVQDADFRVVYSDDDADPASKKVVPVFGTIDNPKYDPNAPTDVNNPGYDPHKINKKVLAIDTASIRVADIRSLVAGDLIADSIVSNTTITSPTINGGAIRGGTLGIGSGGPYAGYHTWVAAHGQLYTDNIYASGGQLNNITIQQNCNVLGTIYANRIVGDVVNGTIFTSNSKYIAAQKQQVIKTIHIGYADSNKRYLVINSPVHSYFGGMDYWIDGGPRVYNRGQNQQFSVTCIIPAGWTGSKNVWAWSNARSGGKTFPAVEGFSCIIGRMSTSMSTW